MSETYRALAARLRLELAEVERVAERARLIWAEFQESSDGFLVDATALNLHGFYAGLEKAFASVAARVDRSTPSGDAWHAELLLQMAAELPGVRPPVISLGLMDSLDRYRGFRHVVRNVYASQLDPRQIAPLVDDLEGVLTDLRSEVTTFADRLEAIEDPGG